MSYYMEIKLSEDLAKLVNNHKDSDVQFKVGGNYSATTGDTIQNEPTTIHAHSNILRCRSTYFATMLDVEKQWKESTERVIHKPNVSPEVFLDILYYLYAGEIRTEGSKNLLNLIVAAEEMNLDELSDVCQTKFIRSVISDLHLAMRKSDDGSNDGSDDGSEKSLDQKFTVEMVVREHIFPGLELAKSHNLSNFSKQIISVILSRISVIIASPEAYTSFLSLTSPEYLGRILESDNLFLPEGDIWDIALSWACHQTNISKTAVDAHIRTIMNAEDNDQENGDGEAKSSDGMIIDDGNNGLEKHTQDSNHDSSLISLTQLKQLKTVLTPFLRMIRFFYLRLEDYKRLVNILSYFLSPQRSLKLQLFFLNYDGTKELAIGRKDSSRIVSESTACMFLRKNIFETDTINGCNSPKDLKFTLLFRSSNHGTHNFHEYCDNKGPTLVIAKSTDEYIFGGVNFVSWNSSSGWAKSLSNFLFALPDGRHRKNPQIFKCCSPRSVFNEDKHGPSFGNDLLILRHGYCSSKLPENYKGKEASDTALAGKSEFRLSDYEVYAISKT